MVEQVSFINQGDNGWNNYDAKRLELQQKGLNAKDIDDVIWLMNNPNATAADVMPASKPIAGTFVEKQNKAANQAASSKSSFDAQAAGLSAEQIIYLAEKGIITAEGNICTLADGQDVEAIARELQNHKTESFLDKNTANPINGTVKDSDSTYNINITTVEEIDNDYGAPDEDKLKNADLESRSERKKYRKEFKASLEKWLAEDESHVEKMNQSIAEKYYAKDIEKQYKKLAKKPENEPFLLVQDYMKGLPEDDDLKSMYNQLLENGRKALTANDSELEANPALKEMRDGILDLQLKSNKKNLSDITGDPEILNRAITEYAIDSMKENGVDLKDKLLRQKAYDKVMNGRSDRQIERDREKFLKYMSKREVQYYQDENRINKTVCCYSKDEYKDLKKNGDPNMRYVYIGKYARKMVENRPDLFCDEVTNGGAFDVEANGKKYKFNSEKYKDAIGDWTDNKRTDGNGGNYHATLSEVRNIASGNKIFKTDDNRGTLEDLYGNGNGHVGYWENRRTRNIIKGTGRSVDKDRTNWKIAEKTAEKTAITFALGFVPGLAASADLKKVFDIAGHAVSIPQAAIQIPGHNVDIPPTKVTSTNTVINNGRTSSTTNINNVIPDKILVDGKLTPVVNGKVEINGQTLELSDYITKLNVDGKEVSIDKNGNISIAGQQIKFDDRLKTATRAGAWLALAALPVNLISSLGIQDRGDTDDTINLYTKRKTSTNDACTIILKGDTLHNNMNVDGWSVDKGVMNRNKVKDYSQATQLATGGKVRAQAVYASEGIAVTPTQVDGVSDYSRPETITLQDKTNNGKIHTYQYKLVTPEEAQAYGLADVTKPLYKLVDVTDENGAQIRNADSPDEVYRLELETITEPTLYQDPATGEWHSTFDYKYNLLQDDARYPGYNKTSMDYRRHSNYFNRNH